MSDSKFVETISGFKCFAFGDNKIEKIMNWKKIIVVFSFINTLMNVEKDLWKLINLRTDRHSAAIDDIHIYLLNEDSLLKWW